MASFKTGAVLALVGLVLAGLVVEGGLRAYAELRAPRFVGVATPSDDTVSDPLLVAWFKADYVAPGGWPAYDASGFRLNGAPRPSTMSRPAAVLGGSTAYGWDTLDEETIPAVLEQSLRSRGHPDAVVINAGFPGLTTLDTLLVYHARLAPLHPATVVVLAGLNDIYYAVDWIPDNRLHWASRTYELGLRARHEQALRPLVDAINRLALDNCYTCYALGASLSGLYDRTHLLPMLGGAAWFGQEPLAGDNQRAMQLTAWTIGELARRVGADGGCLIVAWQPIAGVPDGTHTPSEQQAEQQIALHAPTWPTMSARMFAELQAATRPVFASGQAVEVDATRAFDGEQRSVYQEDGVHYTALGNRLVADAIQPALSRATCAAASG
ncbi:MAG TPA: SGNH/GDSL hydrolase family protein [Chloroflexota bacterium]